jgi:hypothetical protein
MSAVARPESAVFEGWRRDTEVHHERARSLLPRAVHDVVERETPAAHASATLQLVITPTDGAPESARVPLHPASWDRPHGGC